MLTRSFLTKDLIPVSRNMYQIAEIGLKTLDDLDKNRVVNAEVRRQNIEFLKTSSKPHAVLLLMIAPSVEALVEALRTE